MEAKVAVALDGKLGRGIFGGMPGGDRLTGITIGQLDQCIACPRPLRRGLARW